MTGAAPSLAHVIADGRWLAHRYDEAHDSIQFRFVDREAHRKTTFLTDAELGDGDVLSFRRADCVTEARRRPPPEPRLIVHSAYCCSTMLARAFDLPGVSMGFKEPVILNDVIGLQLRGGDRRRVAAALDAALLLLARPLAPGEASVIKPSTMCNPLLPVMIAMRPQASVLLLHAPLEDFLASVAAKGIEGRAWVRELMWKLIRLGQAEPFGFSEEELYRQTDLQVAALGWLAQQGAFAAAAQANADRVRTLDSETLTHRPVEAMAALAGLFALDFDAEAVARGPAFTRHSKSGAAFAAGERDRERDERQRIYAREVEMVMEWGRRVADHAGIPLRPRQALLG